MPEPLKVSDERAAELREQLAKLQGEWRPQFTSAVADLLADRETLTTDNERLTKERDDVTRGLCAESDENHRLTRERDAAHEALDANWVSHQELSAAREEVAKLTRERDKLLAKNDRLDSERDRLRLLYRAARKCFARYRAEVERLRASLPLNDNRTRNEAEMLLGNPVGTFPVDATTMAPCVRLSTAREVVASLLAENAALRSNCDEWHQLYNDLLVESRTDTRTEPQPIESDTTINEREMR